MAEVIVYSSNYCPYCSRAKQLLKSKSIKFTEINVDSRSSVRQEMTKKCGQTSVPQIWINSQHIGGCDDIFTLERAGKLDQLLAK